MVHLGEPHEVADRYLEINFGRDPEAAAKRVEEGRGGDGEARIVEAWIEDEHGERQASLPQGQRITLKALVNFMVDVEDPVASVYVLNEEHVAIVVATTGARTSAAAAFAPARRRCSRSPSRTCSPPGATTRCSRSPTAAPAST